ncbi:MAG: CHAT domain-containing protein [Caulobacter sp.]|nr:CHAT domain-containing protein [Caulobacter sp.]
MNEDDISTRKLVSMLGHVLAYGYPFGSNDEDATLDFGMGLLWIIAKRKKWQYISLLCIDWARRNTGCPLWESVECDREYAIAIFVETHRISDALYMDLHHDHVGENVRLPPPVHIPIWVRDGGAFLNSDGVRGMLKQIRDNAISNEDSVWGVLGSWAALQVPTIFREANKLAGRGTASCLRAYNGALADKYWVPHVLSSHGMNVHVRITYTYTDMRITVAVNGKRYDVVRKGDETVDPRIFSVGVYGILRLIQNKSQGDDLVALLGETYDLLFREIFEQPEIASEIENIGELPNLIISTYGALAQVPFAAVFDGRYYLAERFTIIHAPPIYSCEPFWVGTADPDAIDGGMPIRSGSGVRFLADNSVESGLSEVSSEIEFVSRCFSDRASIVDAQTLWTNRTLSWLSKEPGIAIISAHMDASAIGGQGASILTPQGEYLTFSEFSDNELDADLLVLAGCGSTAKSDWLSPYEDSLVSLCRRKGISSVISTQWSITDSAARIYSEALLSKLENGCSRAEAHGAAQRTLMKARRTFRVLTSAAARPIVQPEQGGMVASALELPADHPFIWAPFVLSGAWR